MVPSRAAGGNCRRAVHCGCSSLPGRLYGGGTAPRRRFPRQEAGRWRQPWTELSQQRWRQNRGVAGCEGGPHGRWAVLEALAVRGARFLLRAALQLDGKRRRRGQLNPVAPGQLFHVVDSLSKRRFLVDTGAAYSIFPHTSPEQPSGPALQGPGGREGVADTYWR